MADNVTLPASSGTFSAASDDVGGVQYQRVKLDVGADGASAPVVGTMPVSGDTPTPYSLSSAATTNSTLIAAGARRALYIGATNTGAAVAYLKLYNKATAPTVGTDVPILTITLPAGGQDGFSFGFRGHPFTLGLAFAITNLAADSDTTAVAANQVKVIASYT